MWGKVANGWNGRAVMIGWFDELDDDDRWYGGWDELDDDGRMDELGADIITVITKKSLKYVVHTIVWTTYFKVFFPFFSN